MHATLPLFYSGSVACTIGHFASEARLIFNNMCQPVMQMSIENR